MLCICPGVLLLSLFSSFLLASVVVAIAFCWARGGDPFGRAHRAIYPICEQCGVVILMISTEPTPRLRRRLPVASRCTVIQPSSPGQPGFGAALALPELGARALCVPVLIADGTFSLSFSFFLFFPHGGSSLGSADGTLSRIAETTRFFKTTLNTVARVPPLSLLPLVSMIPCPSPAAFASTSNSSCSHIFCRTKLCPRSSNAS